MADSVVGNWVIAWWIFVFLFQAVVNNFLCYSDETDTKSGILRKLKECADNIVVDIAKSARWHCSHPLSWHLHMSQLSQWDGIQVRFLPIFIQFALNRAAINSKVGMILTVGHILGMLLPILREAWGVLSVILNEQISDVKPPVKSIRPSLAVGSSYKHKPLEINTFCRLLLLYPSWSTESTLRGELIDVPFKSKVYYDALSYAWGNVQTEERVVINGQNFLITTNCAIALRNLRQKIMGRMIWVDSICIDQQNLVEKDEQLKRMEDIYVGASRTILWLGPATGVTGQAMSCFRLGALLSFLPNPLYNALVNRLASIIPATHNLESCRQFLESPWFHRVWTFQECALTKRNQDQLRCGTRSIGMMAVSRGFESLLTSLGRADGNVLNLYVSCSRFRVRNEIYDQIGRSGGKLKGRDVSEILVSLRDSQCTDARDKIYGLLAIFRRAGLDLLSDPSYEKCVSRVYTEAMIAVCTHERRLHLLVLCDGLKADDMEDTPSWIPDFRARSNRDVLDFVCTRATLRTKSYFEITSDFRKLITSVHVVDKIRRVSPHTIWGPGYVKGHSLKDTLTTNLTNGAEQSVTALTDWLLLLYQPECSTQYADRVEAFAQVIKGYLTEEPVEMQLARIITINFMIRVLYLSNPFMLTASLRTDLDATKLLQAEIERHIEDVAAHIPELRDTFFAKDAPLHHLTSNSQWRIMCFMKTCPALKKFYHNIWYKMQDCTFFTSEKGYMGTGPLSLRDEHVIVLIPGVKAPMALNEVGPGQYTVVGPVFVEGLMDGKYWDSLAISDLSSLSRIELV